MIVMRIKGGLGNQLFQYAAAYALAERLEQPFVFNPYFTKAMTARNIAFGDLNTDISDEIDENKLPLMVKMIRNHYVNKAFRILEIKKVNCGNFLYYLEPRDTFMPDFYSLNAENIYIDGYYQSEKYFSQYRKELIRQFTPKYEPEQDYIRALSIIKKCTSVAVHIRRGDFKADNGLLHKDPHHYLLGADYYRSAIAYMRKRIQSPNFFFFSDDMEWVKDNFGAQKDFHFIKIKTSHGDIDDLMLMKNCDHIITANSTFSWWAAWLNEHDDAIRIVPKKNFGNIDMIPDGWVKM